MKLIGSLTSPFVRKVRVVLAEKKLDYKFDVEDVWAADTRIGESNPLGKVPCLVMEGGEAIFDSRVIVEYVDTLSPVGKLIPLSGRERVEVKTWEALADGLLDAAILARMEQTWSGRTDEQRSTAWMSQGLGDRPWCTGNHHSLADIAVGCALGYLDFRFGEITWRDDHPNLAKLYEKISQRPGFLDTAPPTA